MTGYVRPKEETQGERSSMASDENEALRSELETLKKILTRNIKKLKDYIRSDVKASDDKEEELATATVRLSYVRR